MAEIHYLPDDRCAECADLWAQLTDFANGHEIQGEAPCETATTAVTAGTNAAGTTQRWDVETCADLVTATSACAPDSNRLPLPVPSPLATVVVQSDATAYYMIATVVLCFGVLFASVMGWL